MSKYYSDTVDTTASNNELEIAFEQENGVDIISINDEMLTNYNVVRSRAKSILLSQGYISKKVSISTYHIDGLHIGDIISVDGILYKAQSITNTIIEAKVSMTIVAERWE